MKTMQEEGGFADEQMQPGNTVPKTTSDKIIISSTEGFSIVKATEILRCEADANYTRVIFTNGKTVMASRNLMYFERLLEDLFFVRIHHKSLINLMYVRRYIRGRGGYIEMHDGTQVEVSTRKKEEFMSKLSHFARGLA